MKRSRSTNPMHRRSRPLLGAIAIIGALETALLTVAELTGSAAAVCPTSGCKEVLSSPYATVLGQPLTLFGFLGYTSMAIMAIAPLLVNADKNEELRQNLERWTWLLLFGGATAMAVGSSYLMYIMAFKIQAFCPYCVVSALLSGSMLVLTLVGRPWEDIGQLLFTGVVVGIVTLVGALGVYANVDNPTIVNNPAVTDRKAPPIVTTTSGPAEIALARHLKNIGAKKYSAYWCPHCHEQKQMFGSEAASLLNYIECAPDGLSSQTELCKTVGITGFPTWEINGQLYSGVQSLSKLADLSGYTGPRNFIQR
ncbi:MAG: vitamin K epoxide reductase family protein [Hormoscilla sp. GUM202]|nr:vitamin K epoxide reductase family protein [Hormoscilla sp. GUM202]